MPGDTNHRTKIAIRNNNRQMTDLLFLCLKGLQLWALVVLLQPILVSLQHEPRSQGAKRRIHHSKDCPSPSPEKGIFFGFNNFRFY